MDTPEGRHRYRVVADRSAVMIEARSTVGPITFATSSLTGEIELAAVEGAISLSPAPVARLEVAMSTLVSGNTLYDAELHRRVDARRFPSMSIEMTSASPAGSEGRYTVAGRVTIHGTERTLEGAVIASLPSESTVVVLGEQRVDIRDFDISAPAVAMLKIYPDVRVLLHLEAERVGNGGS